MASQNPPSSSSPTVDAEPGSSHAESQATEDSNIDSSLPLPVFLDQTNRQIFTRTEMHGAYLDGIKLGMQAVLSALPPGVLNDAASQDGASEVEAESSGDEVVSPILAKLMVTTGLAANDLVGLITAGVAATNIGASADNLPPIDTAPSPQGDAESPAAPAAAVDKGKGKAPATDDDSHDEPNVASLTPDEIQYRIRVKTNVEWRRTENSRRQALLDQGKLVDAPRSDDSESEKEKQAVYEKEVAADEEKYERWGLGNMNVVDGRWLVEKTAKQVRNEREKVERKAEKERKKLGQDAGE